MAFLTLARESGLITALVQSGRAAVETIGESVEGRPIRMLRLGNPPPGPDARPALMLVGMQHGLEPAGREAILRWAYDTLPYLSLPGGSGNFASTPHHASLGLTGSLDLRAEVQMADWGAAIQTLVGKYDTNGNQRAYRLTTTTPSGAVRLYWSTNGSSFETRDSTVPISSVAANGQRVALRATLEANNGNGQHVVRFFWAPTLAGPWSSLGSPVTTAGTTSVFNATGAALEVGSSNAGAANLWAGRVWAAEVRSGHDGGTVVASPQFSHRDPGSGSFADSAGRTWSYSGSAAVATHLQSGVQTLLANHGVHAIPSVNPDGFQAGTRNNANDEDLNRDWIALSQPETRAVSLTVGRLRPMVLIDHHEYVGTVARNDIEAARSYNPQAHSLIGTHSGAIETAILARATTEGWSNDTWGASNRGDLVVLDINSTLRHIVSVIIETNRTGDPTEADRILMQYQSIEEIVGYVADEVATIEADIDTAISDKIAEGAAGTEPFNVRGGNILDPPPLGYQLTGVVPQLHLEAFGIDLSPGVVARLDQRAQPLIPFLFDALSSVRVTLGIRLFNLTPPATAASVEDFAPIVSGSHTMVVEARILTSFLTGLDPEGVDVPILGGDVTLDGTADIRGTVEIEIPGVDEQTGRPWFPRRAVDMLAPYGNEIFVRRGINIGSETLWSPLGYYRVESVEQDGNATDPIRIGGSDRMSAIVDARPINVRELSPSRTVGSVFAELVGEALPAAAVVFDDDTASAEIGRPLVVEESRFEVLHELAESLGKIMFWDGEGLLRVETAPDDTVPLWEVKAGSGVLVSAGRRVTRERVYNAVVATGEGAGARPVRGVAVDRGAASPTRWGGPFGQVPRFYSSPFLVTAEQAVNTARAMLRRHLGAPYSVDFGTVVNPGLRPYHPIRVTHSDHNRELHIMERVTIPLAADAAMTGSTRERSLIVIGGLPS